jgi:hypothetical protein
MSDENCETCGRPIVLERAGDFWLHWDGGHYGHVPRPKTNKSQLLDEAEEQLLALQLKIKEIKRAE